MGSSTSGLSPVGRGRGSAGKNNTASKGEVGFTSDELKGSEELINFLENKLEQHERNLQKRQYEYDALQADYALLEDRFQMT